MMRASIVLSIAIVLPLSSAAHVCPAVATTLSQSSPTDTERSARALLAANPRSTAGRALLAEALAGQARWKDAADTLLEGSRLVPTNERVKFAMVMCEFAQARPQTPLTEARRLFEAADLVASDILAKTPDDHDALLVRSGRSFQAKA